MGEVRAMRPDIADFYNGVSTDSPRLLCPAPSDSGQGWLFCVYAPNARRVQVLGDWNGWDLYSAAELSRCEDGLWRGKAPDAREGQLYKYSLLCADGCWRLRTDPFAAGYEPSAVAAARLMRLPCPPPPWSCPAGPDSPLRIYELHAGSWRRHWDGRYYDFDALADRLIPWVAGQGFTHIELMPPAEYPFDGSWGYQLTGYFAPSARFGGAERFVHLVERCHEAGVGVLADFVPAHFAPDDGALVWFDGSPLYEAGPSDWGSLAFDLASGPVRSFLLSAACRWVGDYGCDGLRVDAVGWALRRWPGGEAASFFRLLTSTLHARFPGVVLIAEDSLPGCPSAAPIEAGGLGFDYVWEAAPLRELAGTLSRPFGTRGEGPILAPEGGRCIQAFSHDDCTLPGGALLPRMYGSPDQQFAQARLFLLYQAALPGKQLLFSGCEFGQQSPFDPGREPDWHLLAGEDHRALADYCGALGQFYAAHPALFCQGGSARWQILANGPVRAWLRSARGETLLCLFHLEPWDRPGVMLDLGKLGWRGWMREVFASGAARPLPPVWVEDGRLTLDLPGFCAAVLTWE